MFQKVIMFAEFFTMVNISMIIFAILIDNQLGIYQKFTIKTNFGFGVIELISRQCFCVCSLIGYLN